MTQAKYDELVQSLTSYNVALTDASGELRSTYDVIADIAKIWDNLTSMEQAGLATAISGTRQQAVFFSLVEQFQEAEGAMDAMANSAGTLQDSYDIFMESVGAHFNQFKAAFQTLSQDVLTPEFLTGVIDLGTSLVNILDSVVKLTNKIGGLRTVLIGLATVVTVAKVNKLVRGLEAGTSALSPLITRIRGVSGEFSQAETGAKNLATTTEQSGNRMMTTFTKVRIGIDLVVTAIGIAIAIYSGWKQKQEEAIQEAQRAAEQFQSDSEAIDDYQKRVLELKESLDAGNLSHEEAYAARQELLSIQDEIKKAYGEEAAAIDLVGSNAADATAQLNGLTAALAREQLTEKRSEIAEATKQMEKRRTFTFDMPKEGVLMEDPAYAQAFRDVISKYGAIEETLDREGRPQYSIAISAATGQMEQVMSNLASDLRGIEDQYDIWLGDILDGIENEVKDVQEITDKYRDIYEASIQWKILDNDTYAASMGEIADATDQLKEASVADYTDATARAEALTKAIEDVNNAETNFKNIEFKSGDAGVQKYMQGVIDELQAEADKYRIELNIIAAVNGDEGISDNPRWTNYVLDWAGALADADGTTRLSTVRDVGGMIEAGDTSSLTQDQINAYSGLTAAANLYHVSIDDLLNLLTNYGLIVDDTVHKEEQLGAAQLKLSDSIENVQSKMSTLTKAMQEMTAGGIGSDFGEGLSVDTLQAIMSELDEAGEDYRKYIYEENGLVKLNTEAWLDRAKAIAQNDWKSLTDSVALYKAEQYSLEESLSAGTITQEEYDAALAKVNDNMQAASEKARLLEAAFTAVFGAWTETLAVYDGAAAKFKNLADLQEILAKGYTLSGEEARKYAEIFPDILTQATVTATGEILLNEDVANSFIEAKNAEYRATIDSQIRQLQAKRDLAQAELDIVNNQLEAYESGDEDRVEFAKDTAFAQIALQQAIATACEQAGVDEETANNLATYAMSGDWWKFSTVLETALSDMDTDSADVFTQMMNNFATVADSVVKDNNDIIDSFKKVWDAVKGKRFAHGTTNNITFGNLQGAGVDSAVGGLMTDIWAGSTPDDKAGDGKDAAAALEAKKEEWKTRLQEIMDDFLAADDTYKGQLEEERKQIEESITDYDNQITLLKSERDRSLETFSSSYGKSGSSGSSSSSASKKVEEYIAEIDRFREARERLRKSEEDASFIQRDHDMTDDVVKQIKYQRQLIDAYTEEQAALHNLNEERDAAITTEIEELERRGFIINYDPTNNQLWIENLERLNTLTATNQGSYETLQEATNAYRQETEKLIDDITSLNEENREGSAQWWELQSAIHKAKAAIIDDLKSMVEAESNLVDTYQNVWDVLHNAADEYAQSGYITVDSLQEIIALGPQYMQFLMDENGLLRINDEAIKDVIKARTEQLALEQAMTYVERLKLALQEGSIEDLDNLLYATEKTTDATWGLVYSNLALLDLDGEQFSAALHNINALRQLSDVAMSSVGQQADALRNQLEDMKDGLDGILKYVMDMLKQQLDDQIDALEQEKEDFSDIIELRKAALNVAKEEADYQEGISDKVKELAELEAKINALSLDDSRSAQAERAKLEEERAELQKQLASDQADYARDAQLEVLDDINEAFGEEKDNEIEGLRDTLSSYQKLYDAAINYIRDNWGTLLDTLLDWNYEYGSVLNSEITEAWNNAAAAAEHYGDIVSAFQNIDTDIAALDSDTGGIHNDVLAEDGLGVNTSTSGLSSGNIANLVSWISQMYKNSQDWWRSSDPQSLSKENEELAGKIKTLIGRDVLKGPDGVWYLDRVGGEKLFDVFKDYIRYHSGGIVGSNGSLKQNEVLSILEKGEAVLDAKKESALFRLVDFVTAVSDRFDRLIGSGGMGTLLTKSTVPSTSSSLPPVSTIGGPHINFGDVYIYGANNETVERHREVNRQFANEIIKYFKVKR